MSFAWFFCPLPKIQQGIRKVKVSIVGFSVDYGDHSFSDFIIVFTLAVFFFLSTEFSIPDTLSLDEKLESRWALWLFYGLRKETGYLKGISCILLISRQASSCCFIHDVCIVDATVLVGYLPGTSSDSSMRNVASLFFTTDLAVLKEAENRTWISDSGCQVVVKSSVFLLMGTKRISLCCCSKHIHRTCCYFVQRLMECCHRSPFGFEYCSLEFLWALKKISRCFTLQK